MKTQSDFWHVKMPSGETRRLSLDELDAAFNDGAIDENTPVLPSTGFAWTTLGEVAGLDDDNGASPPPASIEPNSIAPMAISARAVPMELDFDVAIEPESDATFGLPRPRRGRKIISTLIVLSLLGGLGFAGFRARVSVQRAVASRLASGPSNDVVEAQLRAEARAKADADAKAILDATAKATADAKANADADAKAKADADAKAKKGKRAPKRK